MKQPLAVLAMLGLLVACTSPGLESGTPAQAKALGLLEVTLDFSDATKPLGSASFKPFLKPQGLHAQTLTTSGNETSRIKLLAKSLSLIDDNENTLYGTATRYVRGTFDVANFGTRSFNNLNFMATSLGTKIGTAFSNLQNGAGSNILDTDTVPGGALTYRAIKPTHGMKLEDGRVTVEAGAADMQIFTPNEASSVQSGLSATYPGLKVLEYGFTARKNPNVGYSRSIAVTPTSGNCSSTLVSGNTYTFVTNDASCFLGRVTFAFKIPRHAVRAQSPSVFTFVFVVADETNATTTQGLEEQTGFDQVALRNGLGLRLNFFSTPTAIRTLPGSGLTGYSNPGTTGIERTMLCNVKTAAATTTPVMPADFLSTAPGITSVSPTPNMMYTPGFLSGVDVGFCDTMNAPTISSMVLHTDQTGRSSANTGYSGAGNLLTVVAVFKPGEGVEVSLNTGIVRSSDGAKIQRAVYRFKRATTSTGANLSFTALSSTGIGASPVALAVGDFNNDNNLDFASLNSSTISIGLGNGLGAFSSAGVPIALLGLAQDKIITSDFNNDGKLDLAVGDYNKGMGVLIGNGLGSFTTPTYFGSFSGYVRSVVAGDFTGDGKLDLAALDTVPTSGQKTLDVLVGNGTSFSNIAGSSFNVGVYSDEPTSLVDGDFNGDGRLDLAVIFRKSNSTDLFFVVWMGNGAGGFAAGAPTSVGSGGFALGTVGDFNNDGKLDLAFAAGNSNVGLLLGDGVGGFDPVKFFAVSASPTNLVAGDFNGDGNLDLSAPSPSTNTTVMLWGNGTGGFSSTVIGTSGLNGTPYFGAGDFNNDGKLDLLVPNRASNSVMLLTKN